MIPKILHYCWYGDSPIPDEYAENIRNWGLLHPGWEIKKWDESNSPMDNPYLQHAKSIGNWANMANFIRFHVLAAEGGVYVDTDVRIIRAFDDLLEDACFLGFEEGQMPGSAFWVNNAVLGAEPSQAFILLCLDQLQRDFDGSEDANLSAPHLVTAILREHYGLHQYGDQRLGGVHLYESGVFYPIHYNEMFKMDNIYAYITDETYAVHTWGRSWLSRYQLLRMIDGLNEASVKTTRKADAYERIVHSLKEVFAGYTEDGFHPQSKNVEKLVEERAMEITTLLETIRLEQQRSTEQQSLLLQVKEDQITSLLKQHQLLHEESRSASERVVLIQEEARATELKLSAGLEDFATRNASLAKELELQRASYEAFVRTATIKIEKQEELAQRLSFQKGQLEEKASNLKDQLDVQSKKERLMLNEKEVTASELSNTAEQNKKLEAIIDQYKHELQDREFRITQLELEREVYRDHVMAEADMRNSQLRNAEQDYRQLEQEFNEYRRIQMVNNEELERMLKARTEQQRNMIRWYQNTFENRNLAGIIKDRILQKFK